MYYPRPLKNRRNHEHRIKCGFTIAFPPISDRYRSDDGILGAFTHSDFVLFSMSVSLFGFATLLTK